MMNWRYQGPLIYDESLYTYNAYTMNEERPSICLNICCMIIGRLKLHLKRLRLNSNSVDVMLQHQHYDYLLNQSRGLLEYKKLLYCMHIANEDVCIGLGKCHAWLSIDCLTSRYEYQVILYLQHYGTPNKKFNLA